MSNRHLGLADHANSTSRLTVLPAQSAARPIRLVRPPKRIALAGYRECLNAFRAKNAGLIIPPLPTACGHSRFAICFKQLSLNLPGAAP